MIFDIITIFPEIFKSFANEALIARARKKRIISLRPHSLRKWTDDPHRTVDDRPYGGGAGMVLMAEPILKAVTSIRQKAVSNKLKARSRRQARVILFSAKGKKFDQATARRWSKLDQLIMICGRYEGVDERIARHIADEEISIGDYVLFGGEVPAMAVVEAVTRLLPGAVGKQKSLEDESFNKVRGMEKQQMRGLLEYPHFTRPEKIVIKGKVRSVPKVLLTGNHAKTEVWRLKQSVAITKKRRPDLLNVKLKNQNLK